MLVDFVTDSQVKKCLNIRFSKIALRPTKKYYHAAPESVSVLVLTCSIVPPPVTTSSR
jgi:hypothetical protein